MCGSTVDTDYGVADDVVSVDVVVCVVVVVSTVVVVDVFIMYMLCLLMCVGSLL